jgi:hypothetical protein
MTKSNHPWSIGFKKNCPFHKASDDTAKQVYDLILKLSLKHGQESVVVREMTKHSEQSDSILNQFRLNKPTEKIVDLYYRQHFSRLKACICEYNYIDGERVERPALVHTSFPPSSNPPGVTGLNIDSRDNAKNDPTKRYKMIKGGWIILKRFCDNYRDIHELDDIRNTITKYLKTTELGS